MIINVGVYNIESGEIVSVLNPHMEMIGELAGVYNHDRDHALFVKNKETNEITIITGSNKVTEVRNAITALLS